MSAAQYQSQLQRKAEQRRDAENKAGRARSKESEKCDLASKARQAASRATSPSTQRSKLAEAERREKEAQGLISGHWCLPSPLVRNTWPWRSPVMSWKGLRVSLQLHWPACGHPGRRLPLRV